VLELPQPRRDKKDSHLAMPFYEYTIGYRVDSQKVEVEADNREEADVLLHEAVLDLFGAIAFDVQDVEVTDE